MSRLDRLLWVLLRRVWPRWKEALVIVKPETVIAWHRAGFRLYWRWRAFLANHREAIAAFDFFTVPTATFGLLYCFFVIDHGRRRIMHFNVTSHPTAE